MGIFKTVGKIIAAPVTLPVKAAVGTVKLTGKVAAGTAKVAGKMAYRTADEVSFHALSSIEETIKERKK